MPGFDVLDLLPRDAVQEVNRAEWREANAGIKARIGQLPADATGKAGEVVAINDAETGAAIASQGGTASMTFAGRRVTGFRFDPAAVTAAQDITDQHCGQQLQCANTSGEIDLNIVLDADPTLGVSDGFTCEVLCLHGSDGVRLTFSGVTNREPSGNTRVAEDCAVRIQVIGTDCYVFGTTEP